MHEEEIEIENIDLMAYISVAWKRRWQIIILTIALTTLAAIVSFLLPKFWEVDSLLIPSKFMVQTQTGEFKVVLVTDPKQIASQITQGSYNSLIAAEMNIPIRGFPKIKAENIRDTNLVRVYIRDKDPQKGAHILSALFNHIKSELDRAIDVEISSIGTQIELQKSKILDLEIGIESLKIEKVLVNRDIQSDKNKIAITERQIIGILEEMKSVKTRVSELDNLQKKNLAEDRSGTETLSLLLYSNEVQQNLRYYNTLDEKVSTEKKNTETLSFSIKSKEQQLPLIDNKIGQIKNAINTATSDIKLLEDKKKRIDFTQLVKEPTQSMGPVSPKKKLIVLVVGFLSFCLSLGTAFFREYLGKQKKTGLPKAEIA